MQRPPGPPPDEVLLRLIAERRPELTDRLEQVRRRSPERFRGALVDALLPHLDETLDNLEKLPESPGGPEHAGKPPMPPGAPERPGLPPRPGMGAGPGGPPGMGPGPGGLPGMGPGGPSPEVREHLRGLEEKQRGLEGHVRELAEQFRGPQAEKMSADEKTRLREELGKVLNEQFDVRTELRKTELDRIGHDLTRLREALEKMQKDFETRQQERAVIVERRMNQLLGGDATDW